MFSDIDFAYFFDNKQKIFLNLKVHLTQYFKINFLLYFICKSKGYNNFYLE